MSTISSLSWEQLDFEGVIGVLHGWVDSVVKASLDIQGGDDPVGCMQATGRLRGSGDLVEEDASLDSYRFELAATDHLSGFELDRRFFHGASWDGDHLVFVRIGEPRDDPDRAPELALLRYAS